MVSVGNAIIFAAVKGLVEQNARIAKTAMIAVAVVATTAANLPGMMDAGAAWKEISNDLGTLSNHLSEALAKGEDWVADDKDAFETSLTNFKGEIEFLKTTASDIAGVLDTVSNIYIGAYVAIAVFAGACLVILLGLLVLLFIPHTSAAARVMIESVGLMLTAMSTKVAIMLSTMATAVAALFGGVMYGMMNIRSKGASIPSASDFEKIRIDYKAPTKFEVKKSS